MARWRFADALLCAVGQQRALRRGHRVAEARGLRVIPAFASGLDARPAVKAFFMEQGEPIVDAVVSLTGFSLVGGPAYNDTDAAQKMLEALDVPYLAGRVSNFKAFRTGSPLPWASCLSRRP